ncbi:MAG: alpha/beta hydrolase [Methanoregula sp.]|nr:alpha/beta hydrolase [Methanoregula sp.]
MRSLLTIGVIMVLLLASAGCTGTPGTTGTSGNSVKPAYSVDNKGILSVACAPVTTSEEMIFSNESYTKTRIVMHTQSSDVVTYLAAPKNPKAAMVYAPGAGEKITGHDERMVRYAAASYAFMFTDTRGNGAETPGLPFSPQLVQLDYSRFENGEWPQYYLSVCDLVNAQKIVSDRFSVPVYVMGSSNGGRYAAVAAGVEPQFAGYVGISTSDWGLLDSTIQQGYTRDPVRFATSVEPSTYFTKITPRTVWIFHAVSDPFIPFANGKQFFDSAKEPKKFIEFYGDHGINSDVDTQIIMHMRQIYATRE